MNQYESMVNAIRTKYEISMQAALQKSDYTKMAAIYQSYQSMVCRNIEGVDLELSNLEQSGISVNTFFTRIENGLLVLPQEGITHLNLSSNAETVWTLFAEQTAQEDSSCFIVITNDAALKQQYVMEGQKLYPIQIDKEHNDFLPSTDARRVMNLQEKTVLKTTVLKDEMIVQNCLDWTR